MRPLPVRVALAVAYPNPDHPVRLTSTEAERFSTACSGRYAPWHRPIADWWGESSDHAA